MNTHFFKALLILLLWVSTGNAQSPVDTTGWWKKNNLRLIQVNLPDYEAASLDPDSLVKDLRDFSANTLLINAGGIMAFYPTRLPFQYTNPYMKPNMLGDVIEKCHAQGIRVMVRFDFSRVHESIFKAHPDWCYISAKGDRIINTDMYVVSINAPYVQDCALKIIGEVIDRYPVDGIFLNMPGYQTGNPYEGKYYGIDQNEYDRQRFTLFSKGMALPAEEKKDDPVFQKYLEFKKSTLEEWSKRLYELVKHKSSQIAICTYSDKWVDIIRHESQTNSLPYWPYSASDNVGNASNSYPQHIISNSSIQQISFQSRFNAVEPEETAIRLYENIANGSGLDVSLMGDLRGYEDERNFAVIRKIYAWHKQSEAWFGHYRSVARIVVIAPGPWPSGGPMQEYRGILLMLKEAHIPFDIIEDAQIAKRADNIKNYRVIILPEISWLDSAAVKVLKEAGSQGLCMIATNRSFYDDSATLFELFGAKAVKTDNDGYGNYLDLRNKAFFKRFDLQKMIFWKYNLGLYRFPGADAVFLPILTKGRPGPPEIVGGNDTSGYYAMGIKQNGSGQNALLPGNIGKLYYLQGYKEHKHIFLDILEHLYPDAGQLLQTNAPERVECILKEFDKGLILHLVNLTGFSGNTYFKPLPVQSIQFTIQTAARPASLFRLSDKRAIPFSWNKGMVSFTLDKLEDFESIVIGK